MYMLTAYFWFHKNNDKDKMLHKILKIINDEYLCLCIFFSKTEN